MNIIAVDDKKPVLLGVEAAIREAAPNCVMKAFTLPQDALAYARRVQIDVAFLDIDMPGMNGLILAKELKDICGKTNIVFVTGYAEYAVDAFTLAASGYILKPAEPAAISRELARLRDPVLPRRVPRVRFQCFGNFGVFVNGKLFVIQREKPRELLAYLVHKRGAFVRTAELAAVLWEDKATGSAVKANLRQVVHRLMDVLRGAGIEDIILKRWDQIAVDIGKVDCDYYDFLDKKTGGVNAYAGEYLSEYTWAEFTISFLNRKIVDAME